MKIPRLRSRQPGTAERKNARGKKKEAIRLRGLQPASAGIITAR